ncbi:hypothetical protein FACS1894105_08810 [Clostridia bacterium]|nr:hypothetical protein FACS1894105_08810 [Clostridia bacterium]
MQDCGILRSLESLQKTYAKTPKNAVSKKYTFLTPQKNFKNSNFSLDMCANMWYNNIADTAE